MPSLNHIAFSFRDTTSLENLITKKLFFEDLGKIEMLVTYKWVLCFSKWEILHIAKSKCRGCAEKHSESQANL